MPRYEDPKYKDIESIMIRLEPISKCIDYLMETVPKQDKLYQKSIDKHRKIRQIGLKMFEYSDSILKVYDKEYQPCLQLDEIKNSAEIPDTAIEPFTAESNEIEQVATEIANINEGTITNTDTAKSPKWIMSRYYSMTFIASRMKYDDKVLESLVSTFYAWFYERYNTSSVSNSRKILPYNASQIIKYIDCFIVTAGYYIQQGNLPYFEKVIKDWIFSRQRGESVDSFPPDFYDLAYNLDSSALLMITPQAIYIENKLKSVLFNPYFLEENRHTIRNIALTYDMTNIVAQGDAIKSLTAS